LLRELRGSPNDRTARWEAALAVLIVDPDAALPG